MTSTDALPAADRRRAAALLLACLNGGPAAVTAVLDECEACAGGLAGLIAALASGSLELLIATAGPENARRTLELALLDAQMDSSDD